MTTAEGYYELPIIRPGQYYLGINLNNTPTSDTPYPRWFYPGTKDPRAAAVIEFSGKPGIQSYNLTLPDQQQDRVIEGIVTTPDGQAFPNARVTVFDSSDKIVAHQIADRQGRFLLHVFADISYRFHAVWPDTPDRALSAAPTDIHPGTSPLSLRLILDQPGNSLLAPGRKGPQDNDDRLQP